jgi:hypothetical protein
MLTITDTVAVCNALRGHLDAVVERVAAALDAPGKLAEVDALVREEMLALGDLVVAHVVQHAGPALRQQADLPPCPTCGSALVFKQHRKMQVRTALTGEPVTVDSPYFVCDNCPTSLNLVRHAMHLDADGRTLRLRELATIAGTIDTFDAAASQVLAQLAGVTMSANGVHGICQEQGELAERLMKSGHLGQARQLRVGEVLYVMADGCMIWVDDGWHEAKIAVLFPSSANVEVSKNRHLTTERQVLCTLGDRDDLGRMVWNAVRRWMPPDGRTRDRVVFISDGSVWLQNMVEEHLPGAFVLLDWYHMAEHVSQAASVLYGADQVGARRWRKAQEALLMAGRPEAMLAGLSRQAKDDRLTQAQRDELKALHQFLGNRKHILRYSTARGRGYMIGSGPVESAANHVVQNRMKRAGMRWERQGAAHMLALRAAWRSIGGFDRLREAA